MPPTYSDDLKWRIIYLQNDGYSKRKISEILYVSIGLINKVLRLYRKWGTVVNPWKKIPGQHKTFDRNDMNVGINNICSYNFIICYS
jgi:transposase